MKKETMMRIYRAYRIILAVFTVIAGACLIFACLAVYNSGEYSREAVSEAFSKIAVPVYIFALLAVAGAFVPASENRQKGDNSFAVLAVLGSKKDLSACGEELKAAILAERKRRKKASLICASVTVVSAVAFLVYALNPKNFEADINASVINAVYILLPCLAFAFAAALFTVCYNKKSVRAETALLKTAPNAEKGTKTPEKPCGKSENALRLVRAFLVLAAAGITVYGYFSGGFEDVLTKAVNICTECIGLG